MKKNNFFKLLALMLSLVLLFVSCDSPAPEGPKDDGKLDDPVTAEAVFENFIKFNYKPEPQYLAAELLSEKYGNVVNSADDYILFCKQKKDFLNNITSTYTLYTIEPTSVTKILELTTPDEFYGVDDFGHQELAPKTVDVKVEEVAGVMFISAKYTVNTPIDPEIIEKNELETSYVTTNYTEFYNIDGKLLATSYATDEAREVSFNGKYTILSFGKTNVMFDSKNKVVKTSNGDTDAPMLLYDYSNDKYDYVLESTGGFDPSIAISRMKLVVYDKEGNIVLTHKFSEKALMTTPQFLSNGDVLIQSNYKTNDADADLNMGEGLKFNVETYLLDVETGKVTQVEFDYNIFDLYSAEDLAEETEMSGLAFTDNVRNIALATPFGDENGEPKIVFFDNALNINYVYDFFPAYDVDIDAVNELDVRVLSKDYLLIDTGSNVTKKAIFKHDGTFVTYVPNNAVVTASRIVIGEKTYDFTMKLAKDYSSNWSISSNYTYMATIGDCLVYQYTDVHSNGVTNTVYFFNSVNGYVESRSSSVFVAANNGYAVVYDTKENEYTFINTAINDVLTFDSLNNPTFEINGDKCIVKYGDGKIAIVSASDTTEETGKGGKD